MKRKREFDRWKLGREVIIIHTNFQDLPFMPVIVSPQLFILLPSLQQVNLYCTIRSVQNDFRKERELISKRNRLVLLLYL